MPAWRDGRASTASGWQGLRRVTFDPPVGSRWICDCDVPDLDIGAGETLSDIQYVELYPDWDAGVRLIVDVVAPLPQQLKIWLDLLRSRRRRRNSDDPREQQEEELFI